MIRSYSELVRLPTFKERYEYLRLFGKVGEETFGPERYLNQKFYNISREWREARDKVIIRDNACDLGIKDRQIFDKVFVHHMNPITVDDIVNGNSDIYNPEYLICVSKRTHDAIHYGDEGLLIGLFEDRKPGDTKLW